MTANAQMLTVCRVSSAHWMHIILFSLITILVYIYPIFLLRIFLLIFEDFIRCNLIISSPTPPLNSSQIHPYLSTSSVGGKKKRQLSTKFNFCCSYTQGDRAMSWSVVDLTKVYALSKKTDSPSPRNPLLPIAPPLGAGLVSPSRLHARMSILYSLTGNHRCRGLLSATVLSCPEDIVLFSSFLTSSS